MPTLPMVGDELAGYRLRGVLGRGGMSVVYEAENPRLGSTVALKVLAPELVHRRCVPGPVLEGVADRGLAQSPQCDPDL